MRVGGRGYGASQRHLSSLIMEKIMADRVYNLAILVFEDVEVLDFAGPFEAFSTTGALANQLPFNVFLVAETAGIIHARGGLRIAANHQLDDCPKIDILLGSVDVHRI